MTTATTTETWQARHVLRRRPDGRLVHVQLHWRNVTPLCAATFTILGLPVRLVDGKPPRKGMKQ